MTTHTEWLPGVRLVTGVQYNIFLIKKKDSIHTSKTLLRHWGKPE